MCHSCVNIPPPALNQNDGTDNLAMNEAKQKFLLHFALDSKSSAKLKFKLDASFVLSFFLFY